MNKRVLAAAIAALTVMAGIFAFSAINMKPADLPEIIQSSEKVFVEIPSNIKMQSLPAYNISDGKIIIPKDLYIEYYPDGEGYYIVQFAGPIYEEYKNKVVNSGGKLYGYVPEYAFIVKMNESAKNKVQNLDIVKWIGIYQPAYRISPSISKEKAVNKTIIVDVSIFDVDENNIISKIRTLGGEIISITQEYIQVSIDSSKIPELAKIKDVLYIAEYREPELA